MSIISAIKMVLSSRNRWLTKRSFCSVARFRWYQGFFSTQDVPPEWAVDNVYIGMQCMEHCGGHGTCINGMLCQCDEGYNSDRCVAIRHHPTFLKEDFECEFASLNAFGSLVMTSHWLIIIIYVCVCMCVYICIIIYYTSIQCVSLVNLHVICFV